MNIIQTISPHPELGYDRTVTVKMVTMNYAEDTAVFYFKVNYSINGKTLNVKFDEPDYYWIDNTQMVKKKDSEGNPILNPNYTPENGDHEFILVPAFDYVSENYSIPFLKQMVIDYDAEGKFNF